MSLILMPCVCPLCIWRHDRPHVCVFQALSLPEEERHLSCTLHDQEVQLWCHDVFQLSTLQRAVARSYGHLTAVCSVVININVGAAHLKSININALDALQIW